MVTKQSLQVLFNVLSLLLAGWLTSKAGLDKEGAAALAGAIVGVLLPLVLTILQRRNLLYTEPPPKPDGGDAAIRAFTHVGNYHEGPTRRLAELSRRAPLSPSKDTPPAKVHDNPGGRGMLLLALALFPLAAGGCNVASGVKSIDVASIRADQARRDAIEPVLQEHVSRHPEQAETWTYFLQAWGESIDTRRKLVSGAAE